MEKIHQNLKKSPLKSKSKYDWKKSLPLLERFKYLKQSYRHKVKMNTERKLAKKKKSKIRKLFSQRNEKESSSATESQSIIKKQNFKKKVNFTLDQSEISEFLRNRDYHQIKSSYISKDSSKLKKKSKNGGRKRLMSLLVPETPFYQSNKTMGKNTKKAILATHFKRDINEIIKDVIKRDEFVYDLEKIKMKIPEKIQDKKIFKRYHYFKRKELYEASHEEESLNFKKRFRRRRILSLNRKKRCQKKKISSQGWKPSRFEDPDPKQEKNILKVTLNKKFHYINLDDINPQVFLMNSYKQLLKLRGMMSTEMALFNFLKEKYERSCFIFKIFFKDKTLRRTPDDNVSQVVIWVFEWMEEIAEKQNDFRKVVFGFEENLRHIYTSKRSMKSKDNLERSLFRNASLSSSLSRRKRNISPETSVHKFKRSRTGRQLFYRPHIEDFFNREELMRLLKFNQDVKNKIEALTKTMLVNNVKDLTKQYDYFKEVQLRNRIRPLNSMKMIVKKKHLKSQSLVSFNYTPVRIQEKIRKIKLERVNRKYYGGEFLSEKVKESNMFMNGVGICLSLREGG